MSHVRLLLVLRDPAERTLSEYKNKRDLMLKGGANAAQWVWGHRRFGELAAALEPTAQHCSYDALYAACESCSRSSIVPGLRCGSASWPGRAAKAQLLLHTPERRPGGAGASDGAAGPPCLG